MLDSPYVRRTAISLRLLGIPFEQRQVSVFRHFDEFGAINPVVKAPTLVTDDGATLMDSSLIIQFAESMPGASRSLLPSGVAERFEVLRVVGLALAACEKSISIIYEREIRPAEMHYEPWMRRVGAQLRAALKGLEDEIVRRRPASTSGTILQDGITTAVTWSFLQLLVPDVVAAADYPAIRDFAAEAEKLPEFVATPQV